MDGYLSIWRAAQTVQLFCPALVTGIETKEDEFQQAL